MIRHSEPGRELNGRLAFFAFSASAASDQMADLPQRAPHGRGKREPMITVDPAWWEHLTPGIMHPHRPAFDTVLNRFVSSRYGRLWLDSAMTPGGLIRASTGQAIPVLHVVVFGDGSGAPFAGQLIGMAPSVLAPSAEESAPRNRRAPARRVPVLAHGRRPKSALRSESIRRRPEGSHRSASPCAR